MADDLDTDAVARLDEIDGAILNMPHREPFETWRQRARRTLGANAVMPDWPVGVDDECE